MVLTVVVCHVDECRVGTVVGVPQRGPCRRVRRAGPVAPGFESQTALPVDVEKPVLLVLVPVGERERVPHRRLETRVWDVAAGSAVLHQRFSVVGNRGERDASGRENSCAIRPLELACAALGIVFEAHLPPLEPFECIERLHVTVLSAAHRARAEPVDHAVEQALVAAEVVPRVVRRAVEVQAVPRAAVDCPIRYVEPVDDDGVVHIHPQAVAVEPGLEQLRRVRAPRVRGGGDGRVGARDLLAHLYGAAGHAYVAVVVVVHRPPREAAVVARVRPPPVSGGDVHIRIVKVQIGQLLGAA